MVAMKIIVSKIIRAAHAGTTPISEIDLILFKQPIGRESLAREISEKKVTRSKIFLTQRSH